MLIRTIEELRLHLPNHAYDDIESMTGAFKRSEADVLKSKVGNELYARVLKVYNEHNEASVVAWLLESGEPYAELAYLCQEVIVFDAFMREADKNAISVNQSGINVVSAENYDAATKDGIAAYKKQLNADKHDAINRLLLWLEEACEQGSQDAPKSEIVELWKQSKYYYMVADLFINTATMFDYYVSIHENREKFVSLLPDLRYCQQNYIENELGEELTASLLAKQMDGTATKEEQKAIGMIRQALALLVEARSKMFNRPEAKDEAIGSVQRMAEYVQATLVPKGPEPIDLPHPILENNRRDDAMFIMPTIY